MPNIDLSILNQRQTPAFYADVFANRPAAGFVGRIFVSTDTYAFYRDNGTGWDLIGGPGTGTVTGSGAAGQVAFWSGSSLISGENNLWWDSTNNHFGINTNTPGTAADIHHDQSTILQLNQTTATNDTRIAFQNGGSSKWRVGNFYSAGSNDYKVNDAVLNINRFTIKSSSGQTFVGDETTSSGLFVVNNSSGDAHIVALGATAPSIRVRNAGVGASLQFGLGLATTTNNFIQGSTGGEFCIFNDSLTAQPILFGIKDAGLGNTQEAARISAARNFLIGTTTDAGQKFQVGGTSLLNGVVSINTTINTRTLNVKGIIGAFDTTGATDNQVLMYNDGTNSYISSTYGSTGSYLPLILQTQGADRLTITAAGNVGIGTTSPTEKLVVSASSSVTVKLIGSVGGGATNNTQLRFYGQNAGADLWAIGSEVATGSTGKAFDIYNTDTGTASFRITGGSNNVLIGTTTDNGKKLQLNGSFIQNGNNTNYQANTQTFSNGGTVTFDRDNSGYGGNLGDNIAGQIIVSISEPNSNTNENCAVYVGTVNKPRGNDAVVTQISKTLGNGITAFTVTNSGNVISVTATSSTASTLRVTLTFIGGGGLS